MEKASNWLPDPIILAKASAALPPPLDIKLDPEKVESGHWKEAVSGATAQPRHTSTTVIARYWTLCILSLEPHEVTSSSHLLAGLLR